MASPDLGVVNIPGIGFSMQPASIGQTLTNVKTGLTTTQTPIYLSGATSYTLGANQFASALQSALFVQDGGTITLPSTITLLNVLSDGSLKTFGAWVSFTVINQSQTNSVNIVAGDVNTNVTQVGTAPNSTQTYIVYEVLGMNSAFQVCVVQDVNPPSFGKSQYLTAQLSTTQTSSGTLMLVPFDVIFNQSPSHDRLNFLTTSSTLVVGPGVSVLINASVTVQSNLAIQAIVPVLELAPAGQVASPLVGTIAGSSIYVPPPDGIGALFLSVAYSNTTSVPTMWQLYISDIFATDTSVLVTASVIPELTVVEIV